MDTYHWDVLVMYHEDVNGCLIWDLFQTSWRRYDGTSLLRPFETSLQHSNKTLWRCTTETSWRRSIETLLSFSFEAYLRRRWDVQRDIVATLSWRLNAGWGDSHNWSKVALEWLLPSDAGTIVPRWHWRDCFQVYFDFLLCILFCNLLFGTILH